MAIGKMFNLLGLCVLICKTKGLDLMASLQLPGSMILRVWMSSKKRVTGAITIPLWHLSRLFNFFELQFPHLSPELWEPNTILLENHFTEGIQLCQAKGLKQWPQPEESRVYHDQPGEYIPNIHIPPTPQKWPTVVYRFLLFSKLLDR